MVSKQTVSTKKPYNYRHYFIKFIAIFVFLKSKVNNPEFKYVRKGLRPTIFLRNHGIQWIVGNIYPVSIIPIYKAFFQLRRGYCHIVVVL